MRATSILASLLLVLVSACEGDPPPGGGPDAAADPGDAGMEVPDAAMTPDAGPAPTPDAGPVTPDAGPLGTYGEPCTTGDACMSGLCLTGPGANICSRACDVSRPNDCRAEGTLCLPLADGSAVCFGPSLETGVDDDDAVLSVGDCVTRSLRPLGADADLFQIRAAFTGAIAVTVQPEPGVDVQLEVYDGAGELVARQNMNTAGGLEGIRFGRWTPDSLAYILVADAGSTIANPYRICVAEDTSP